MKKVIYAKSEKIKRKILPLMMPSRCRQVISATMHTTDCRRRWEKRRVSLSRLIRISATYKPLVKITRGLAIQYEPLREKKN